MHELDQKLLRRACDRVAPLFREHDFFCAETGARLAERLALFALTPEVVIDLGSGPGSTADALRQAFPAAQIVCTDWSAEMLAAANPESARVCADAHTLPFADSCADIVFSNLMLPGCERPQQVFHEARRVLRNPGVFLFSTLGPDSLKQLRRAWATVDDAPHVHAFADMHNIGDALVEAGFREPVMDVESLTVTYADPLGLVRDLRAAGATNLLLNRRRGLTPPQLWRSMLEVLDSQRNAEGRLEITMEVVSGQAWTGEPPRGVQMQEGEASFPVSRLKN